MSEKSERVHALVNAGSVPGMSEAFDAHMGAACWTDPDYAQDASMWAAAWKASADVAYARDMAVVDKCNSYIADNARLAKQVDRLRDALTNILEVSSLQREPHWSYRNTITLNLEAIKAQCLNALHDAGDLRGTAGSLAEVMYDR